MSFAISLFQDVRRFIDRTISKGLIRSFFYTSEDQAEYDRLCQRLHFVSGKLKVGVAAHSLKSIPQHAVIQYVHGSEKQSLGGPMVIKAMLETFLKRLKLSRHIVCQC
jgi:hypothetical protein